MTINTSNFEIKHVRLIVILLLLDLMIIPGSATVTTNEQVWVIRSSGNIGIHEKIEYGTFSVKVHEFLDDRVSLAMYKNNNFLELFDFYEGEWRQYQNIRVEVHRIEGSRTLIALSTSDTRTIWTELEPATAVRGDHIQRDFYGIEISSFDNDSVHLIIDEGKNKPKEEKYHPGEQHTYGDDFKIYVSYIDRSGYVDIRFFKKAPLSIHGDVRTLKEVYKPGEQIRCLIEISNSGNAPVRLLEMDFRTDPDLNNDRIQTVNDLSPHQTRLFEVPVLTPDDDEDSYIFLNASVTLIDYSGEKYTYLFSKNIYISTGIGITKAVIPPDLEFQDDSRSVQNIARVQLNVFNAGTTGKNVSIYDYLPENISLYNSSNLEWAKDIAPGEIFNITYYIIPDVPGKYSLPSAEVSFNNKMIYSGTALFSVHAPRITIQKSGDISGGKIIVTNTIQNMGDRAAHVMVIDTIPEKSTLIEGNEFWTGVMQPGEWRKLNYSLQNHNDLDSLPGAGVQYKDIQGNNWHLVSNSVELKSLDVKSINMISDVNNFLLFLGLSYITLVGLILCVLIVIGFGIYMGNR